MWKSESKYSSKLSIASNLLIFSCKYFYRFVFSSVQVVIRALLKTILKFLFFFLTNITTLLTIHSALGYYRKKKLICRALGSRSQWTLTAEALNVLRIERQDLWKNSTTNGCHWADHWVYSLLFFVRKIIVKQICRQTETWSAINSSTHDSVVGMSKKSCPTTTHTTIGTRALPNQMLRFCAAAVTQLSVRIWVQSWSQQFSDSKIFLS